jgi:hypothetical protein
VDVLARLYAYEQNRFPMTTPLLATSYDGIEWLIILGVIWCVTNLSLLIAFGLAFAVNTRRNSLRCAAISMTGSGVNLAIWLLLAISRAKPDDTWRLTFESIAVPSLLGFIPFILAAIIFLFDRYTLRKMAQKH